MDSSTAPTQGNTFYLQLLDSLDHAVIAVDTRGTVTYWNRLAESLLGWSAAEIVGSPLLMLPDSGAADAPALKRVGAGDIPSDEVRLLRKDGLSVVVRLNQCALHDATGTLVGYVTTPTEVASGVAERATPDALDDLNQIILSEVLDAAFLTDDVGRLVAVPLPGNFGYTEAEFLSFVNIAFVLQTDPFETREFSTSGELRNRAYTLIDKAGKHHSLLINMKPVSIMGGTRLYTCREVGVERDNEDAIARSGLLRRVLDTIPVGVWVADKDGQIMLSNPADRLIWAEPSSTGRDAYSRHRAWSADSGQPLQRDDWALAKAIRSGEVTLNDVLEIEGADGTRKTILNSAAPIRDEQGNVIGGIAVNQDITEQRRMEKAERKHRTFANALSNITAMLTSSLDLQTVMERILDNVGRVVPHEAANIMLIEGDRVRIAFWHNYGPQADEMFRNNTYPLDMPVLKGMLTSGLPGLVSDTHTAADWIPYPETDWVRSAVSVPIRARDTILGFLNLDSSEPEFFKPPDAERLRAFAYQAAIAIENARLFSTVREYADELETRVTRRTTELRAAKDHVEAILEHSSDGIALVTNQGIITQVNPSFTHLFALDEESRILPVLPALIEEEAWGRLKAVFDDEPQGARSIRIEVVCHALDGSTFDADLAIAPLFDAASQTYLYVCNVRDVTQQKMAERELRSALEKEKELNELKTRFVAMVSHEFRTPLASIQTSTDLLGGYHDRLTSDHRNEIIQRIQLQIQRLTELLEDVMTVAKADTVGLVLDVAPVDMVAFCTEAIKDLRYSTGIKRQIELQSRSGSLVAEIDKKLFHQVMVNLLSNAVKYSPENSLIDLELESVGDKVVIQVRDHGIGIPKEDMPDLFNAFHRASNVGDRYGTGLGLAVVKRAVEAHQGTVELESAVGVGTSFTITVPKRQPR
jgi:PAS domain S-box-containing protein